MSFEDGDSQMQRPRVSWSALFMVALWGDHIYFHPVISILRIIGVLRQKSKYVRLNNCESFVTFFIHCNLLKVNILVLHMPIGNVDETTSRTHWLWSPYIIGQTIIFLPCSFYILSSSFFFYSSPNLSGRRLDVYHTSTHGVP